MTFEEAIRKSMRTYWEDTEGFDGLETSKGRKYTKSYFDKIKSDLLDKESDEEEIEIKKPKSKSKSKGIY